MIVFGYQQVIVVLGQVVDDFIGGYVDYYGIDWYGDGQVFVIFVIGLVVYVVFVVLCFEDVVMVEVDQGVQVFIGVDIYVVVCIVVVVVWVVEWNEFFVMEVNVVVVVVVGEYFDFCFVYQFYCFDVCDGCGLLVVVLNVMFVDGWQFGLVGFVFILMKSFVEVGFFMQYFYVGVWVLVMFGLGVG